jgi:surface antigen
VLGRRRVSNLKRNIFSSPLRALLRTSGQRNRRIWLMACVIAAAPALSACSITFPIFGAAGGDEPRVAETTSSLALSAPAQPASPLAILARDLGPEDLRRALGAMALALDPQGNGTAVGWNNPESGLKGVFTPVGGPFLNEDHICRAFLSSTQTQIGAAAHQGTACRPSGGEWVLRDLGLWKKPT